MNRPVAALAILVAQVVPVFAEEASTISLVVENDSFIASSDRHYTNGLYGSWTSASETRDDWVANWASDLMLPGTDTARWRTGYFFGQSMFTPEDLTLKVPDPTDRPYASWLYAGARLYRENGDDTLDKIELSGGVVGPASLGDATHQWWHALGLLGGRTPRGWEYQIRNEAGLVFSEQRTWRVSLLKDELLEVEALPQAGFAAGNFLTYAQAGGMLRFGQGLQSDWGPSRAMPGVGGADFQNPVDFTWYLFAGVSGRAVGRNVFLDGNSFQPSRSVDKKVLVGDFNAGISFQLPTVGLSGTYTRRTPEFVGQRGVDEFLSLNLSISD